MVSQLRWAQVIGWTAFTALVLGSNWRDGWSQSGATPLVLASLALGALVTLGFVGAVLAFAVRGLSAASPDEPSRVANPAEAIIPPGPAEPSWAAQDSVLHDLSNAMTASLFMVRDLTRALDKGTEPSLGRARSLSQALVTELSQISEHIRTSRQSVRLQPIAGASVQLLEPIECCVELVSKLYPDSLCRVECEPAAKEAVVSIIGGEATLKRIVENLVLNACQSQTSVSKTVNVVCRIALAGDTVTLSIEDNGPGFSRLVLDSFPSPSLSTKPQGTGIGLYSCHQLVKRDGGKLALSNSNDGGARVIITWPGRAMLPPDAAAHGDSEISISGTRPRLDHVTSQPPLVANKP